MNWNESWRVWAAAFGGKPGRFFEAGEVRLALLSLLSEGARHGYELMKDLESRSGGVYRASAGTIYPTLQLMEDEGQIVGEAVDGKRVYTLTASGRAELESERARVERIWARARRWHEVGDWSGGAEVGLVAMLAGELVGEAMRAVKRLGRNRGDIERVRAILEEARQSLRSLDESDGSGEAVEGPADGGS
jgi:DNA-binding PadR family transcriptional regulator